MMWCMQYWRDAMSEQGKAAVSEEATVGNRAVERTAVNRQTNAISDPREVAAVVMARMNVVNAKKDELTIAIKGLTDLTQQLVRAYAGQVQLIEQLATRVKALEEATGTSRANGQAAAPGMPGA
jgi:hypothetical protein